MSKDWQSSWNFSRGVAAASTAPTQGADAAMTYEQMIVNDGVTANDIPIAIKYFSDCQRICDLGCGTGRLMVALADLGMEVLGIDLSWEMLDAARQKLALPRPGIALIRANLIELDAVQDATFHGAACLFSTLGMIRGRDARRELLRHVHRILTPGGRFLLHAHNYWHLLRVRGGTGWMLRDLLRWWLGDESAGDFDLAQSVLASAPVLHHFTRLELQNELESVGFRVLHFLPISTRPDGRLSQSWFLPTLRAYGWIAMATRA